MSQSNYLSEAELEAYQADGFLIRESVYDPQQLEDLRLAASLPDRPRSIEHRQNLLSGSEAVCRYWVSHGAV